ncbi:MAG: cation:proton antiporter [Actinomycetes bacterium]|jgi:CPA1 family monovalent cation:H+ antiporter|nr:cation:proton antiporter [Actinomycetes bacterium]
MASFEVILVLLGAVLLSSIINQFIPDISVPLIQVALGIVISLFLPDYDPHFDYPNFFILLFIAPLLFNDALRSDRAALWKLRQPIAAIVVGLVFLSTAITGFTTHALLPFLPLAACFALAASLGPTDAVSVSSLSERTSIPDDEKTVLQGESLFNDASGIIAFTFAVTAMVTGHFSVWEATGAFFITFLGGLVVGTVLAFARSLVVTAVRSAGMENATFHVLIELLTPFIIFIVAEHIHVAGTPFSGIIAVVSAGLFQNVRQHRTTPTAARLSLVSSNVWAVLSFALNGIVFLLMGTQIPHVVRTTWLESNRKMDIELLLYIVIITAIVLIIRFAWTSAMMILRNRHDQSHLTWREQLRKSVILAIAGVRGTVTLATVLTIPYRLSNGSNWPHRDLIIFLASGVIILTMLLANFVLPLLTPKEKTADQGRDPDIIITILRQVILKLNDQMTPKNRHATEDVVRSYNARIRYIRTHHDVDDSAFDTLRLQTLSWEKEHTVALMRDHKVSTTMVFVYLYQLNKQQERIEHRRRRLWLLDFLKQWRELHRFRKKLSAQNDAGSRSQTHTELHALQLENANYALGKLNEELEHEKSAHDHTGDPEVEDIATLILEYQNRIDRLRASHDVLSLNRDERLNAGRERLDQLRRPARTKEELQQVTELKMQGLRLEREAIQQMFDDGKLTRQRAKKLRDNVALMELDLGGTDLH